MAIARFDAETNQRTPIPVDSSNTKVLALLHTLFVYCEGNPHDCVPTFNRDSSSTQLLSLFPIEKQAGVQKRFQELVDLARAVLPQRIKISHNQHASEIASQQKLTLEEFLQIRQAIIDLYILSQPHANPDSVLVITETEQRLSSQLGVAITHTSRTKSLATQETNVWVSDISGPIPPEYHQTYFSTQKLEELQIPDTSVRWLQIEEGLLDHTLIASELLLQVLLKVQHLFAESGPHAIENFDPYEWAIKMLLHDFGRLITHDRSGHAVCTDLLLEQAGIDPKFYEHLDLPNLFSKEYPPVVSEMLAGNIAKPLDVLFLFVDVMGKNTLNTKDALANGVPYDPSIMRVPNILERVQLRAGHYGKNQGNTIVTHSEPVKPDYRYGPVEAKVLSQIALWVQSEAGLDLHIQEWDELITKTEQAIFELRNKIGLEIPYASQVIVSPTN